MAGRRLVKRWRARPGKRASPCAERQPAALSGWVYSAMACTPRRPVRSPGTQLEALVPRMDARSSSGRATDTVPTGFASLDRVLGGGMRRQDLVVLAGDVGSGKSALALGIAIRAAAADIPTMYFSGEMS